MALYIKPWQCHAVFFIVSDWLFREGGLHVTSHEPASGMQSSLQIPVTEMPNHSWWHAEIIASRVWMPSDSLVKCWVCFLIKTVYIVYIYIYICFLLLSFFIRCSVVFLLIPVEKERAVNLEDLSWIFSPVCVYVCDVCAQSMKKIIKGIHTFHLKWPD